MTKEKFETLMAVDKKAANGQLRLILLKGDPAAVLTADFDKNMLSEITEVFQR